MTVFLWVILVICSLNFVGRLIWLAKDDFPPRTRKGECINVVSDVLFIGACVWLLFVP
jgi:hypothetical protein